MDAGGSVVLGGRNEEKLDAAAKEVDTKGARVAVVAGDIADPEIGEQLVAKAEAAFWRGRRALQQRGCISAKAVL